MQRQGTALRVATMAGKGAGCGTRGFAGRTDGDWSRLDVGADAGQMKFQFREFGHGGIAMGERKGRTMAAPTGSDATH